LSKATFHRYLAEAGIGTPKKAAPPKTPVPPE
jgi:hypothetical protein